MPGVKYRQNTALHRSLQCVVDGIKSELFPDLCDYGNAAEVRKFERNVGFGGLNQGDGK